jgi:hypothetical protein
LILDSDGFWFMDPTTTNKWYNKTENEQ